MDVLTVLGSVTSTTDLYILDSNGEKCVLAYGACNFGTSNPTALGDNADLEKNITIDFKITEVEPEITFTVNG